MLIFYKICCNHLIYLLYQIFFKKSNYLILVLGGGDRTHEMKSPLYQNGALPTELPRIIKALLFILLLYHLSYFSNYMAEKVGVEPTVERLFILIAVSCLYFLFIYLSYIYIISKIFIKIKYFLFVLSYHLLTYVLD